MFVFAVMHMKTTVTAFILIGQLLLFAFEANMVRGSLFKLKGGGGSSIFEVNNFISRTVLYQHVIFSHFSARIEINNLSAIKTPPTPRRLNGRP